MAGLPNPHQQKIVAEACQKHPDHGNSTIAKALHKNHPELFLTVNQAICAVRYHRGNRGQESRDSAAKNNRQRENSKGTIRPLPDSEAKPWEPFELCANRVLILSDLHVPYQDNAAVDAALEYGQSFKPDAVLINGDLFDFYQLSRFEKDPSKLGPAEELRRGKQFFEHVIDRLGAPIYFKLGNHDERFEKYIFNVAPLLAKEFPDIAKGYWRGPSGIDELGITVIDDQRPVMFHGLRILHGHEKGRGISSPVNPARGAFMRLLCSVLEGHGHRTSEHTERTADGAIIACRTTGCLCGLWPDYARINKWDHGFATVSGDGDEYHLELHRIVNGKVY